MHAVGHMRRDVPDDRALDRADVGQDGAVGEMRRNLCRHLAALPHGNAQNDEIRAVDGGGARVHDLIGKPELGDAGARRPRPRRRHDAAHEALRARSARDRRADQAGPDQRQAIEEGLAPHQRASADGGHPKASPKPKLPKSRSRSAITPSPEIRRAPAPPGGSPPRSRRSCAGRWAVHRRRPAAARARAPKGTRPPPLPSFLGPPGNGSE